MSCSSCHHPKSELTCGLCQAELCKACTEFVDEERLSFRLQKSAHLSHLTYCPVCFSQHVQVDIENYDAALEKAKGVLVFERKQGKETRLVSRKEKPVFVKDCKDHDETILRMAFQAVELGYNAIVDVSLTSKKIKDGSYSTVLWSGQAVPANVDESRLPKDKSLWPHPN